MKLPLFLYLHTLFFDKLPLHLTVSPIHQIWPSPTVSFISPQEVLSQLIFKFLSCLPSPPSLWLYTLGKRQDCKPAAAVLTSAGNSGPTENAMWWGPGHTLHPSQLYHSMAPSYPAVTRHIYQPLVFIAAPHKKQVPTSWFRITLHTPTLNSPPPPLLLALVCLRGLLPPFEIIKSINKPHPLISALCWVKIYTIWRGQKHFCPLGWRESKVEISRSIAISFPASEEVSV